MTEFLAYPWIEWLMSGLVVVSAVVFYGRFYLQWIVSERLGRSVIPIGFWYMSATGSGLLFIYALCLPSPIGALSHCFNLLIYGRNLIHVWRERGVLTRRRSRWVHGGVAVLVFVAAMLAAHTWFREYQSTKTAPAALYRTTWIWLGVGVAGQGLFALRFALQWLVTEIRRKSVIPASFWYISVAAALLLMSAHLHRREWVFGIGIATTLPAYLRNIWLIRRGKASRAEAVRQ